MKLTRELHVAAPLEAVWARVTERGRSGWYSDGVGAGVISYEGRTALDDLDDDEHVAGFHLDARERDGSGTALGRVSATLAPVGDRTRVWLDADLAVAGGGQAVGEAALDHLARSLEGRLPDAERPGRRRLVVGGAALVAAVLVVRRVTRR